MNRKVLKTLFVFIFAVLFLSSCTSRRIDSQLKRAEGLKGTRKFSEALQVYQMITSRYPTDDKTAVAYFKMGDMYLYTFNKRDEAISSYTKVIERWPLTHEALLAALKRAEIFKMDGKPTSAIVEYEWILKHFPNCKERYQVKYQIADEYLSLNDPYQASIELEKLLGEKDIDGEMRAKSLFDLGESYLFMGKCEKALKSFQIICKEFPAVSFYLEAELRVLECLEKLNRIDEAIALQKKLLREYPDSELVKKKAESLIKREEKVVKPEVKGEKGKG